ncbi:cytochrome P450 [uncultured Alsobacter sp.]|uniref:cytochrome P450 n=1 Tax=uncultured Alsobacter sp. TaxID=1748258 RepID=UPI0025DB6797|nr:cytochrome P450 [uncultured Alsobacter sp.]
MSAPLAAPLLVPPRPVPPRAPLSPLKMAFTLGRNVLSVWGEESYRREIVSSPFFGVTSFTLNDPEAIRHVFVDNHEAYVRTSITRRMLKPMLGRGLFLAEGEDWRHQRRALAPAFTPRAMDPLRPLMTRIAQERLDQLARRTGRPIDLFEQTQRLTLEIAGRTMFSMEMTDRAERMRALVDGYAARVGPSVFDLVLPANMPNPTDLRRGMAANRFKAFIEEMIAERAAAGPAPDVARDLCDLLLAARDPRDGSPFDKEMLRDQVSTMILAGHETTAVALFWTLLLLSLSPGHQEEAAAEAVAWSGDDGTPLPAQLPVIHAVASEAMRLYPPAFLVTRVATKPDRIGAHAVSPGDMINVSPWLLHRQERLWADPHAFDPRRFMPGAPPIDRLVYLPFGIGPRICIGAHFATTELVLVLAEWLKRFRVERTDDRPVMPVGTVTLRPDHLARFRLHARM